MSGYTESLSLEQELLLAEEEYGGLETEIYDDSDTDTSGSDGEQSQYPYFLSPSHEFETSIHDDKERVAIEGFLCACKFGEDSTPCCKSISVASFIKYRSNCLEMSKDELDLVILGQIHSHYMSRTSASDVRKTSFSSRYFFHDKPICLKTFLFIHSISDKRHRNLVEHYRNNSPEIKPRHHGNAGKSSYKVASMSSVQNALQFIKNIASAMALPLPGRMPNFKDERFLLLPTDMTKAEVHRMYVKACKQDGKTPFCRTKFIELWLRQLPYISVTKPATDLCWDCQKNSNLILRSANLSEAEKSDRVKEAQRHLALAKVQREQYNSNIKKCEDEWTSHDKDQEYEGAMHFSFDYAQQVHYPCNALQPGPLFFKTARKCNLFGVACEPAHFQVNYLIDEACYIGKGSNATTSLLHDFLENRAITGRDVYLQADNCVGQNKNNTVLHYLCWRVSTCKSDKVSLSFMLAGHTKFAPDRYFGLVKRKYKISHVSTLVDIESVVQSSTLHGSNKAQLIHDHGGKKLVTWYDWSAFLGPLYKNLPNITSFHHFRVERGYPGVVHAKEYANSPEVTFNIFKARVQVGELPEEIIPPGLDAARQWYLYEQIRLFCGSALAEHLTCPKPTVHKPGERKEDPTSKPSTSSAKKRASIEDAPSTSAPKRQRSCSYCRIPGHTKSRGTKIACPKLLQEQKE